MPSAGKKLVVLDHVGQIVRRQVVGPTDEKPLISHDFPRKHDGVGGSQMLFLHDVVEVHTQRFAITQNLPHLLGIGRNDDGYIGDTGPAESVDVMNDEGFSRRGQKRFGHPLRQVAETGSAATGKYESEKCV